jgi:AraC-like DNA-binding protein
MQRTDKKEQRTDMKTHLKDLLRLIFVSFLYHCIVMLNPSTVFETRPFVLACLVLLVCCICCGLIWVLLYKRRIKRLKSSAISNERPKISKLAFDKICEGLSELLEQKEVYCKPNLRLDDLAEMLNTNKTYISLVINEYYSTTFYTLINRYRVQKAVKLLDEGVLQIKEIWMLSGFNSQSTFNALFRKEVGMTPMELVKKRGLHKRERE